MDTSNLRQLAQQKYNTARVNLLMMIGFTLLNIILLLAKSNAMMLFSATVPYYAVVFGFLDGSGMLLVPCILTAAIILILYFLCWLLSKRSYGWMIAALVLFALDSVALIALSLWTKDFSGILDIAIHGWVLYYLIIGVKFGKQLKSLPAQEEALPQQPQPPADPEI